MKTLQPPRFFLLLLITALLLPAGPASADQCVSGNCTVTPELYPVGWIPWLADLKSWRNYDPSKVPGLGRLTRTTNGAVVGEQLNTNVCEVLSPGKYTFAMKYQNDEVTPDYINNTDVLYVKTQADLGRDYIRHSQVAAGFPVFCAGEFHIGKPGWFSSSRIELLNELVEVNNFSGHYKPKCKCLGVLMEKLQALGVNTGETVVKFMGDPQDCR